MNICCICLENIPNTYPKTSCGHLIHFKCLRGIDITGSECPISCPLCRQQININYNTRIHRSWKNKYKTILNLITIIHSLDKGKEKTDYFIQILKIMWNYRIIIRRYPVLIDKTKKQINQINNQFLQKYYQKSEITKIQILFKNINNL